MKQWNRYVSKEFLKVVVLFLFSFYFLYGCIDYSIHAARFSNQTFWTSIQQIASYYSSLFATHLDILLPLGCLLATIKTLGRLNIHNELLALQVSGVPLQHLLRPFLWMGLGGTLLLYANEQFLLPLAMHTLQKLEHNYHFEKHSKNQQSRVHFYRLKDGSRLLYSLFHPDRQFFTDVYWIRSPKEVYHMQYLYPYAEITIGQYIDHFVENDQGEFIVQERVETKSFPQLRFDSEALRDVAIPFQEFSISELWKRKPKKGGFLDEADSQRWAMFHKKLTFPWFCFLAILGPMPFCASHRRDFPLFLVYLYSIFAFLGLYMLLDAAKILAERQILSPEMALWPIFILVSLTFGYCYRSMGSHSHHLITKLRTP